MAFEIKGIACTYNQAKLLASGKTKVLVTMRTANGVGRISTGVALPTAIPEIDYLTITSGKPVSLSLNAAANIYIWPTSSDLTVEVVSE